MKGTDSKEKWLGRPLSALGVILLVGALARLVLNLTLQGPMLWPDSEHYFHSASAIALNFDFTAHRAFHTPLYALFLAFLLVLGNWGSACGELVLATQQLLGVASAVLVYLIARRSFGQRIAFVSGLLVALDVTQLFYEATLLTETLYTFILLLIIYVLTAQDAVRGLRLAALSGLLCALLTLTRPVAQFYFIIPALFLVIREAPLSRKVLSFLLVVGVCWMVLLPWCLQNRAYHGFFGVSKGAGINLFLRAVQMDNLPYTGSNGRATEAYEYFKSRAPLGNRAYFDVYHNLTKSMHSESRADKLMLHIAASAIARQPAPYVAHVLRDLCLFFLAPEPGPRYCDESPQGQIICVAPGRGLSHAPFPNHSVPRRSRLKEAVVYFSQWAMLPMGLLSLLAFGAIGAALLTGGGPRLVVALFGGTMLYHALLVALFNVPEDRYRLPLNGLIIILAFEFCRRIWCAARVRNRN